VLIDSAVPVATKLIEGRKEKAISKVRDSIIPSLFIRGLPIKNIGIPFSIRSPGDFGKSLPLIISVGTELEVGKTMAEGEKVNIAIRGADRLQTTNLERAVMDLVLEPFKLTTGMNSLALASVSILVHDGDDRALLGLNNSTNSNNGKASELMAINTTDINSARMLRLVNNADIIASKTTISTTVNKRTKDSSMMGRDPVCDMVDHALELGGVTKNTPNVTRSGRRG